MSGLASSTRPSSIHHCTHCTLRFSEWKSEYILHPWARADLDRWSIPVSFYHSTQNTPPEHVHKLHDAYEAEQQPFAEALVPSYNPDQRCKHGNTFSRSYLFWVGHSWQGYCVQVLCHHHFEGYTIARGGGGGGGGGGALVFVGASSMMDKTTSCLIHNLDKNTYLSGSFSTST